MRGAQMQETEMRPTPAPGQNSSGHRREAGYEFKHDSDHDPNLLAGL